MLVEWFICTNIKCNTIKKSSPLTAYNLVLHIICNKILLKRITNFVTLPKTASQLTITESIIEFSSNLLTLGLFCVLYNIVNCSTLHSPLRFDGNTETMRWTCTVVQQGLLHWNVLGRCWDIKVDNSDISVSFKGENWKIHCEQITR